MNVIRFAVKKDKLRIIDFLKENWNGNSTLIKSDMIFEYQYMKMAECGFVISEEDGVINGVKGYISLNKLDNPDVTVALALVLKGSRPMLNMEMQRFLEKNMKCRMVYSLGLNKETSARIYPLFKYKVDKLKQYYILGNLNEYKISMINDKIIHEVMGDATIIKIKSYESMLNFFDIEKYKSNFPYKDWDYLKYRYFDHPVYKYIVYGIEYNNSVGALFFGREIELNGEKIFRIVDYIGNRELIGEAGKALRAFVDDNKYEYIDFYCYGMKDGDMERAGFILRDDADKNIIPNYFEPFLRENIDIIFFCNKNDDFLICKADGDQDRPNIL